MKKSEYNGIVTFIHRFKVPRKDKKILSFMDVNNVCMHFIREVIPGSNKMNVKQQRKYKIVQENFSRFADWCFKKYEYTEDWKRIKESKS